MEPDLPHDPLPELEIPDSVKDLLKNVQSSLSEITGLRPSTPPALSGQVPTIPSSGSPVVEVALMQIREYLGRQQQEFQQVTGFLLQRVDRIELAIAQLGMTVARRQAVPHPEPQTQLVVSSGQILPGTVCGHQAQLDRQEQTIAELHTTIDSLDKSFREAEARHVEALKAKEMEYRIVLASKRGTLQLKEIERKYALEVARLQQVVAQKEQERQEAMLLLQQRYTKELDEAQALKGRTNELESLLAQREQQYAAELAARRREVADLQQQSQVAAAQRDSRSNPETVIEYLRDFLGTCSLFKNLSPFELSILVGLAYFEEVGANELIIKEGSPADSFYIIVEGEVALTRDLRGEMEELMVLEAGDIFGEGSLIRTRPREATALTTRPTKLLRFSYEDYREIAQSNLPLAKKLPANLMRITNERTMLYS